MPVLAALLAGLCAGLIVSWISAPTAGASSDAVLRGVSPAEHAALVALAWSLDGDLALARERLMPMAPAGSSPSRHMADMACRLASTDFVSSAGGPRALLAMRNLYQLEGQRSCADTLLPALATGPALMLESTATPGPVATLAPPPSKTPMPTETVQPTATLTTATVTATPTEAPLRPFALAGLAVFCDAERPGLLEVYVQEREGRGVPAMELRVRWPGGEDRFFSGLKPERGHGYADFDMQPGRRYRVDMPGRAGSSSEFETGDCLDDGARTLRSWRAVFQAVEQAG